MSLGLVALLAGGIPVLAQPPVEGTPKQIETRHQELVSKARGILTLSTPGTRDEARRLLEDARNLVVRMPQGQWVYRSEEADFYWAWILCQAPQEQKSGRELLEKMLTTYLLSDERKVKVQAERDKCGSGVTSPSAPQIKSRFLIAVSQKGGQWSQPITVAGVSRPSAVHWDQRRDGMDSLSKRLVGLRYTVVESRPFIVIGDRQSHFLTRLTETVLHPYYRHLSERVGVGAIEDVVYVLVATDHNDLARMTNKLYQVGPQDANTVKWAAIAYSDPLSNTMMAICGVDPANCTSFAHELFHLLNFRSYEDAPWWLYEGIPELYESGDLVDGKFRARVGWRKWHLDVDTLNPESLLRLLKLSKNDARLQNPDASKTEMARARFFCHYLHEKDLLWPIYYELRSRGWRDAVSDPSGAGVVEKTVSRLLTWIADDFKAWLRSNVLPVQAPRGP